MRHARDPGDVVDPDPVASPPAHVRDQLAADVIGQPCPSHARACRPHSPANPRRFSVHARPPSLEAGASFADQPPSRPDALGRALTLILRYLQLRARFPWSFSKPRRAAAHEPLRPSRSLALARPAVRGATRHLGNGPDRVRLRPIRTAAEETWSAQCPNPVQTGLENQASAHRPPASLDSSGFQS